MNRFLLDFLRRNGGALGCRPRKLAQSRDGKHVSLGSKAGWFTSSATALRVTNRTWAKRAALAALALACLSPLGAREIKGRTSAAFADAELRAFMTRFEQATNQFINGDHTQWLALASRRHDAMIMGAWGDYEAGWKEVGPRYDWAVARFKPSGAKLQVEYLSHGVSGDVAYTVAIERSEALVVGQDKPRPMQLRVTHVFRKEDGAWKLVHRHADPLMNKTAPADTLVR